MSGFRPRSASSEWVGGCYAVGAEGGQGSLPIFLLDAEVSGLQLDGGPPHPILSGLYYAAAKIEDTLCRSHSISSTILFITGLGRKLHTL
jgi:hypothetical protein